MQKIGIIAEYNPFHNGHLYQIESIKNKYPDSLIIVVMTGNFTERGDVSIMDKWRRTTIALNYGVDLVIELPYPFACQSADYFAYGAVTILNHLKVDKIIFGSESNNIDDLKTIAKTQIDNLEFDSLVKVYSKMGKNYPTAVSSAVYDLTGKIVNTPNDLLGISYLKTIYNNNYNIDAEVIERTSSYHDTKLDGVYASASAIRNALKNKENIDKYVPIDTLSYYNDLHFIDDYFNILKYKIITEEDLSIYQTVDEGIDKVLKKEIINSNSYSEFVSNVKSKRYTYNKITRMLLHILCNFTKDKAKLFKDITYIRILGLNDNGRRYLNSIKKEINIPLISKITKEKDEMLKFELETTKIYDIIGNNLHKEEGKIIYWGDFNDKE